jgi:hypothetical protein
MVNRLVDAGLTDGLLESKRMVAVLMFTLWVRGLRERPRPAPGVPLQTVH